MFVLFSGFNSRLKRHASEISRSSVHFCCGYLIFFVCQPNWYFSSFFLQRSNVFFVHLIFQLYKWLKSRVQPQTSEIYRSSVNFCCSSLNFFVSEPKWYFSLCFFQISIGSLLHLIFQCLNPSNEEYKHNLLFKAAKTRVWRGYLYLSYISSVLLLFIIFLEWFCVQHEHYKHVQHQDSLLFTFICFCRNLLFILVSQPNCYGSLCFLQRSHGLFCSSSFPGIYKVEMKSTTTYIFFNHQKIEYGDSLSIFLIFLQIIFFCSSYLDIASC